MNLIFRAKDLHLELGPNSASYHRLPKSVKKDLRHLTEYTTQEIPVLLT